jgi:MSHA biogenesis protein MshK
MTRALLTALGMTLLAAVHAAPPFADPMQPPNASDGKPSPSAEGGPRLESILIAPDRRLAVINGQQVAVGDRLFGMSVVRILETEVVVRGAEGEQTLSLFPEVSRGAIAPAKRERSK